MLLLELSRIIISEINHQQVILLREVGGVREFPIVIGIFEATSIDRRVKQLASPRPLTHDLFCSAVELLGGRIQDVCIHGMEEQTYFASIRIVHGDELIEIDSRPSDAIAIAVSFQPTLPILIDEAVLERAVDSQ
jgi:bifunctional DNase/RNase